MGLPVLCGAALLACLASAAAPLAPQFRPDETLDQAAKALELNPNDPELLLKTSEAAFSDAEDDAALWYAELARIAAKETSEGKSVERRVRAIRDEIGIEVPMLGDSIDAYSKSIFELAKLCSSKKYYANAADMLGALVGSPYERDARAKLEKLFKKSDALEAMLQAGVPIKVEVKKRRTDAKLKQMNARHSDWENAYEAKGPNYTIKTNMGVDVAELFLGAMEQMNVFYRQIFEHKARGGKMRRCEVRVYKTREEFDQYNPDTPETVAGFFLPSENSVSTYDPRSVEGSNRTIDDLWSTLYHEASHQFTRAVWVNAIPTWLNEGTASYFEGAALLTGGVVETNRIPSGRLRNLAYFLGRSAALRPASEKIEPYGNYVETEDSPGLKAVLSYQAPGSYPGNYYSFGWGMVYFCLNYENDKAERIYEPIYKEFMRSYTKTGGESQFKRFVTYFIDEPAVPTVKTFDDFNRVFSNWIAELARREYGGPEQADKLIAQAKNEIENGHPDYAIESLRWALRKRADDPTALQLLGESYLAEKNLDGAIFTYRTLAAAARRAGDMEAPLQGYDGTAAEALAAAVEGLSAVDKTLGPKIADGIPVFVDDTIKEANAWMEAGYPRVALQAIAMGNDVVGGDGRLFDRAASIQEEVPDASITRTYLLPVEGLAGWTVSGGAWEASEEATEDGVRRVIENPDNLISQATFQTAPKATFRFEVDVELKGSKGQPVPGITFAGGPASNRSFIRLGSRGQFGFLEYDAQTRSPILNDEAFKRGPRSEEGVLKMSIEVGQSETRFYVNDKEVGKIQEGASALQGQIGLSCRGPARFVNPRLTY